MKLILAFWLLLFVVSIPLQSLAQKEIVIDGVKYVQHTVTKSETVFSLCQKYKVTQKEIMQANPGLAAILQAGEVVKIPVGKVAAVHPAPEAPKPVSAQAQSEEENYFHKVGKKQTIFTIAKQYGITANELIRYNPELSNGLVIGQVLKIPVGASGKDGQSTSESISVANTPEDLSGFTIHPVVSGETLFSLEQRYGLSHDEMLKNNPGLQNGLKAGMKLRIPVGQAAPSSGETQAANQAFTKYQVEKGETLFSLAARFGVEVSDLKKANPSLLSRSLESGETILIPQRPEMKNKAIEESPVVSASVNEPVMSGDCRPVPGKNLQKYKVGFLLPLNLPNENRGIAGPDKSMLLSKISLNTQVISTSADTTSVVGGINIDAKTEGFLEFYEGALLAIDSLRQMGMNVELQVFDASNAATINSLLNMDEFRDLNLIVGPVYPELQETVASFAAKNRIPMVSPLAATGNFEQNNSWYFKVNPGKEYQIEQTAAYIANEFADKNFILIEMSGNSNSQEVKIGELSKERLSGKPGNLFHIYSFQKQGVSNLKPLLDETGENIFVLPSDNEAQVSVAVTNLTALAENYNIVLMGTPTLTKMKSIQTENYHKIRLRYLSPYFVDYNKPLVKRFVGLYRDTFSGEPTQFSFQGFDVSYYFLSALFRYGKDFRNCLPDYPMELTQNTFHFRKVSPMGGLLNGGLFITAFERNFDVLNYGTLGGVQSEK